MPCRYTAENSIQAPKWLSLFEFVSFFERNFIAGRKTIEGTGSSVLAFREDSCHSYLRALLAFGPFVRVVKGDTCTLPHRYPRDPDG
jgi:hypothetical protein